MNKKLQKPWTQLWPMDGLESVPLCPVCGNSKREILHTGLVDKVFNVAPGQWTLWACTKCNSAYLDPRPTEDSIGQAYESYFTHNETPREDLKNFGRLKLFRRSLSNGYMNYHYGTQYKPTSRLGPVLVPVFPSKRDSLNTRFCWLTKPKIGQRLLDVGFGSGSFLCDAMAAGWDAVGVDTDPIAVANARERGQNVHLGGIDDCSNQPESFDAVTINNVIEHVHDPGEVLNQVFRVLKPNGILYIDTPNIESHCHRRFGKNWLHLDPPRHLVIFSKKSIKNLLYSIGFEDVHFIERPVVSTGVYIYSSRLESGHDPFAQDSPAPKWKSRFFSSRVYVDKSGVEFLTLLARKKLS